jgi:hypothetical protein
MSVGEPFIASERSSRPVRRSGGAKILVTGHHGYMSMTIVARFAVTGFEASTIPGIDEDWVGAVLMRKIYSEGLIGSSESHFVSSGTEQSGRAYFAAERITASLPDGRSGSFTVHHGALQHPSDPSAFGYIVPGTGTHDFTDFEGPATIKHDDDGPYFVFELPT